MKKIWKLVGCVAVFAFAGLPFRSLAEGQPMPSRDNYDPAAGPRYDRIVYHHSGADPEYISNGFGHQNTYTTSLNSVDFVGYSDADIASTRRDGDHARSCVGWCIQGSTVSLPQGALITGWSVTGRDDANDAYLQAGLSRCAYSNWGPCLYLTTWLNSGEAAVDGVVTLQQDAAHVVDNSDASYHVWIVMTGAASGDVAHLGAQVHWKRQISPGPGLATFIDVPKGHAFFDAIEALAASGVTSGCGFGIYCPDSPVTRGQMAAFLARALGL